MSREPEHLFHLWCSFPDCIGYARFSVGIDGPMVCRRHAREVRRQQAAGHLARLLGRATS